MLLRAEYDIRKLHQSLGSDEMVGEQILETWIHEELTSEDLNFIGFYFFKTGQFQRLSLWSLERLRHKKNISWRYWLESLFQIKKESHDHLIEALIQGASTYSEFSSLSSCRKLSQLRKDFLSQYQQKFQDRWDQYQKQKETFLDELNTLQSQELYQAEEKLLMKALIYFPTDPDFTKMKGGLYQRKAIDFLNQSQKKKNESWSETKVQQDPEMQDLIQTIMTSMWENQDPAVNYDFAIALLQWEEFLGALDFAEMSPDAPNRDWLRVELMIKCRRFVEALSELHSLEQMYANDPDTYYASNYLRAQGLWGLQQKEAALEIMESIVANRPHYRSAPLFLTLWRS